jgi:hypothetical protein
MRKSDMGDYELIRSDPVCQSLLLHDKLKRNKNKSLGRHTYLFIIKTLGGQI